MVLQDGQSIVTKSELGSNMLAVNISGGTGAAAAVVASSTAIGFVTRERDMDEFNLAYELNLAEDEEGELSDDDENDEEDEDDYFYEDMDGEVPVSLAIFVIVLYMSGGAWIFHKFEGWTFTQSFYFVFVTLTTMVF